MHACAVSRGLQHAARCTVLRADFFFKSTTRAFCSLLCPGFNLCNQFIIKHKIAGPPTVTTSGLTAVGGGIGLFRPPVRFRDAAAFTAAHGGLQMRVGAVPYAEKFGLCGKLTSKLFLTSLPLFFGGWARSQ